MREIKFRGKAIYGDKAWLYGDLMHVKGKLYIFDDTDGSLNSPDFYEVHPESVGQFTGLTDKNGKEIFEGDIVRFYTGVSRKKIVTVEWSDAGMWLPFRDDEYIQDEQGDWINHSKGFEIIGNVFSNPELLK